MMNRAIAEGATVQQPSRRVFGSGTNTPPYQGARDMNARGRAHHRCPGRIGGIGAPVTGKGDLLPF
jgi:hypothetical protein